MSERKAMFRQNPNIEIRNPKQIRISNDRMIKTNYAQGVDDVFVIGTFVFRASDFEFLNENVGFRSGINYIFRPYS